MSSSVEPSDWIDLQKYCTHRKRIKTEEKAKVVAAVWGT